MFLHLRPGARTAEHCTFSVSAGTPKAPRPLQPTIASSYTIYFPRYEDLTVVCQTFDGTMGAGWACTKQIGQMHAAYSVPSPQQVVAEESKACGKRPPHLKLNHAEVLRCASWQKQFRSLVLQATGPRHNTTRI